VHNFHVAGLQLPKFEHFKAVAGRLFAYNEVPTIAVAIDCWFRARPYSTRPFLCAVADRKQSLRNGFKYLGVSVDE
jgi:hypothetical protein